MSVSAEVLVDINKGIFRLGPGLCRYSQGSNAIKSFCKRHIELFITLIESDPTPPPEVRRMPFCSIAATIR
jgi:hypothetical protein